MQRAKVPLALLGLLLPLLAAGCGGRQAGQPGKGEAVAPVRIVQLAPANMLQQLKSGEIDGFVAWEPFNAEAVQEGTGKYLATSRDIWPDHPCCVVAAAPGYTDRQVLDALVWAHVQAVRFIQDPARSGSVLTYAEEFTGKDAQVARQGLAQTAYVEYPDEVQFRSYYAQLREGGLLTRDVTQLGYRDETAFFQDFLAGDTYSRVRQALAADPAWRPSPVVPGRKVRLGFLTRDLHQLPLFVAQKEGYYAAVGLVPGQNLEILNYANGVAVMEAFKAGEVDVAYLGGAPATLKRVNDDVRIKILAGVNKEGSALVVRAGGGVARVTDLAGRTVAVPGLGTVQHYLLLRLLQREGIPAVLQ